MKKSRSFLKSWLRWCSHNFNTVEHRDKGENAQGAVNNAKHNPVISFWFVSFPLLFQLILTNVAAPLQVEILFRRYHLPALLASMPQIIWCWCQRPPWWFQGLRYDDYHQGIKGGYKLWAVCFFPLLLSHFFLDIFDWWITLFLPLEPTAPIHMSVLLRQKMMKAHIFCFVLFLLPQWGFHCCGRQ